MRRIGVVVQARVGSTRLRNKVLEDIGGKPAIIRVMERVCQINAVGKIVAAIPAGPSDAPLRAALWKHGFDMVLGSESDVLDRYYSAADANNLDVIVRITGDCPMLDPEVSARVIERFMAGNYDYYSNVHPATYPDGLDTEVFTMDALAKAWTHAKGPEREHVTAHIWKRPHRFRMGNLCNSRDLSSYRWTLDTAEDLAYIRKVYAELGSNFRMRDVLQLPFQNYLPRVDAI
jgi:spore coat polysaccharide biosynthesis protein SpsF (cytidylyltransferase family)